MFIWPCFIVRLIGGCIADFTQPILFCSRFCCWYICHFQLDFLIRLNLSFLLQMTVERKSKSSCRWKSKECWLCQLGCKRVEAFAISTQRLAAVQSENWELFIGKKTSIPLLNPTVSQMQPRRNCSLHSLPFKWTTVTAAFICFTFIL